MPYSSGLGSWGHPASIRRSPPSVLVPVTSLKLSLCLALTSCALLGSLVHAAPASAARTPCWKTLLNDWYDGRIDQTYERHCYQDALHHLPADVQTYSSARDDIQRALQSAIAKRKRAGQTVGPKTPIVPPKVGKGKGKTTRPPGRKPEKGLTGLADKLNPGTASSLPVPLLVLGGLALVLVAAGGAGLVAKRIQARRQNP
jgi:hypothetical protein